MRSGTLQLLLAAIVLFQVVLSEKNSSKTETDNEKDIIIKEETGRVSFHARPRSGAYAGSRSVSRSKSSSKSSGEGSGQGYGYGSDNPDDKGPQGGSQYSGYRGPTGPSYSPSYEDNSKGSSEAYKSSREEGTYHGSHHRDSSPEYSSSYEEHYDTKGRYRPSYQSDKVHTKSYSSTPNSNKGYSPPSGRYDKDDDLPSVSPDGFIESHSNQQTSAEKYDPQEYVPQGYGGPKDIYGEQGYQGGPHLTPSQGYGEHSGRDVNTDYSGPTTYGGFTPMLNMGGFKHDPYSNVIRGKDIDGGKVSFFVKQLGGAPLSQIQGKNVYESGESKLNLGKGQQQGFLLFPVVPKGVEGNTGYGGRDTFSGLTEEKTMAALLKDSGYKGAVYPSQHPEGYGLQHQGRDYVGTSGGYDLGGHQVQNAAYQQDKGGYGQTQKVVQEGKSISVGPAGGYAKQHGPSVGAGHSGQAAYGISGGESYGIAGGHGGYDNGAKYVSPVNDGKTSGHGVQYQAKGIAPANEGYGYGIAGGAGDAYKTTGPSVGGYPSHGSLPAKDYRGVVSFAGGPGRGYAGEGVHGVSVESQGKPGAHYDSAGLSGGAVSYGQLPAGVDHGAHKDYAAMGYVGGGTPRSPESGYGSPKSVDSQPAAPKDKKSKSVAIILQKQPLSVPSLGPVAAFGPELDTQFKTPFKDYLGGGGSGFDFNLGSYGAGISDFGTTLKGSTGDLLHGLDGYGGDLSSFSYPNSNTKFY